ncbi:hypothetical protein [Pseudomonas aeruginosa]|uniref:hypothetical protein n=1 Tax=Pseudomonas aeruginosa TaxID=287 RepID=UPI0015BDDD4A|nr:hypothetical protein [Pseudomonas aeruginosa]QLF40653.1 hypothetical protein GNT62_15155 [Pseudomonas aeruginosa]
MTRHVLDRPESALIEWPFLADSVEKVALAAACRSGVPAVEVAASHFKLPSGVSLSVLAQV